MSSKIRISHVSTAGQIIHFVRDHCLIIYLLFSIFLIIIAKANVKFNSGVKNFLIENTAPVFIFISTPFNFLYELQATLNNLANLKEENNLLKEDNKMLKNTLFSLLHLKHENNQLKDLLKFKDNEISGYKIAKLYLNIHKSYERIAIINKGKNHGLENGQAVVTGDGLIGRILNIFDNYAQILLINDYQSKIPIYSSVSKERAIMIGEGDDFLSLKYLRKNHNIASGEIIFTSGDGKIYPANIPVGIVIIDENNQVKINPFVDFYQLDFVKILLNKPVKINLD